MSCLIVITFECLSLSLFVNRVQGQTNIKEAVLLIEINQTNTAIYMRLYADKSYQTTERFYDCRYYIFLHNENIYFEQSRCLSGEVQWELSTSIKARRGN